MEVYLDNSATTMCYPEVGEACLSYHVSGLRESVGNVSEGNGS